MSCDHKWIGDVCCECGVLWSVWAEREIKEQRARVAGTLSELLTTQQERDAAILALKMIRKQED